MSRDTFRDFPGRVALIGALRVAHVAGVVGVGADLLAGRPLAAAGIYLAMLVGAGVAIALLDVYANRAWLRQVGGLAVLLKASALALLAFAAAFGETAFWVFLVFSVAVAHAPGRLRHARLLG